MTPRRRICPLPGCSREMKTPDAFLCAHHWYQIPGDLRERIWRSYRSGKAGTEGHFALVRQAMDAAMLADPPEIQT